MADLAHHWSSEHAHDEIHSPVWASLTPSERRVADRAAEGRRNREIAHAVLVSLKTVEVHMTSVYRKLSIATRAELRGSLAGASNL